MSGGRRDDLHGGGPSAEERELLDLLLAEEGVERAGRPAIAPRASDEELPLSFAQQRLWFLHRLAPASAVYNVPSAVCLTGPLSHRALAATLSEIARRHEVLRTRFPEVSGRPRQQIDPPAPVALPVVDLSRLPQASREAELGRLVRREAGRPFDLAGGPVWRTRLVRLAPAEHGVLSTLHHVACDGWSMGVLLAELTALYTAFAAGRRPELAELPFQYADYALWQRRWLSGDELGRQVSFWRRRLALPPTLRLPTDRPRPAVQSFRGARRARPLPARLAAGLRQLGQETGTSLFMIVLAGYAALLHRLSGEEDLVVGTPVANRRPVETEALIGYFVNALAVRIDAAGDPSFGDLLARVREASLAAFEHQDLPFEKLIDELELERDLGHTPLFQVLFSLQDGQPAGGELKLPGLATARLSGEVTTAKFELTLQVAARPGELMAAFEYRTDLFDACTVERLLGELERLLAGAVTEPLTRLSALPLLAPSQRHQLVTEWGRGEGGAGEPMPLPGRFFAHAQARPESVAVVGEQAHLSYGGLARRSLALAARLGRLAVAPETRVGVCCERSPELVVALLGVLAAGAAYVPLDPAYPEERLRFLIADSGLAAVLTAGEVREALGEVTVPVLDLGSDPGSDRGSDPGSDPVPAPVVAAATAYVIYTSGSTGRPKGVPISHANMARLFDAIRPWLGFTAAEVWTLFHSFAFDFSVWELWGALAHGGRLVVVPYLVSREPEAFHDLLCRQRVTVLSQTPSAFRQLVRVARGSADRARALRWVTFGGEALELASLRPWIELYGDRRPRLVNLYGITETTVHVTWRPLSLADVEAGTGSLIGRALPDLDLLVLDRRLGPAPIGVPGELHVGGAGLSRGYLGRPALAAERFVPHPFSGRPGARLYQSGDLARLRPDGDAEYLGRIDHQVKVRGFRIEPGEIASALAAHPGLQEAVVLMRRDSPAEGRLVAYVVPRQGAAPTVAELRADLASRLPEQMVPALFVTLPALPRTPHGKLDRAALPAPREERPELATRYAPPRTDTEGVLAGVWAHVLELDRVGIHDSFFALGGDSIRAVQVVAVARERGLELSLQELFQHPTVAGLSAAVAELTLAGEAAAGPAEPSSQPFSLVSSADRARLPAGVEDAYPLAALQAGMLFHMQMTPEAPVYHNVDSLHLRTALDVELFRRAVLEVTARHPVMRTGFDLTRYGEPLQLVHREARFPVGYEDLRALAADEQERVIGDYVESEKRRLFDLAQPPLLRLFIHHRGDRTFQLTLTENHAIFDGWSLHATFTEIFERYFAALDGHPLPPEPPPATTYRDYVALERQALDSEASRRYWRDRLSDLEPTELPSWPIPRRPDRPRRRQVAILLPEPVHAGLRQLARQAAVPLKNVLLAAHLEVLSLLSGGAEVVSGVAVHGRPERPDGIEVRGLFLNTVPLRARVPEGSRLDRVRAAFEAERELLPHRRFPLAAMQRLRPDQPLYQASFNFVHFHVIESVARGGRIEVIDFRTSENTHFPLVAHFRLNLEASHLTLILELDLGWLSDAQARQIEVYYRRTLAALAGDPSSPLDREALLTPAERHLMVWELAGPARRFAVTGCLPDLFAEQARRRPAAVALVAEGRLVSYGELARRAARLACALATLGVGPETRVPLVVGRGPEMVVGILAILAAGGAYVPLDPSAPRERLDLLLADSQRGSPSPVLLTTGALRGSLGEAGVRVIDLEAPDGEPGGALGAAGEALPDRRAGAAQAAYVIYTSGSTGLPKGVVVTHANVVRLLRAGEALYRFGADDVWTLFHSYAFDFSVWELWGALAHGGRLVIVPHRVSRSPEAFWSLLLAEGVTVLNQTPSAFRPLMRVAAASAGPAPRLRWVIFGGEALDLAGLEPWWRRMGEGGPRLVNMYGITETTVHVTYRPLAAGETGSGLGRGRASPIGRVLPDLGLHVLDRRLRPLPLGVPGEAVIGGAGVARGYLHRPGLTAERFVPDPWGAEAGERLYRSGDRVRHRPGGAVAGELEYLGRIDRQVKIRGFRVELGEVQARLTEHPQVAAAVALVEGEEAEEQRIVAYVVGGESPPDPAELRRHLRRYLPEYMVPASFILLDEIPLTVNGKLDRGALPRPAVSAATPGGEFVAPRSALERTIAEVWREVLKVDRVGLGDNFFDLGGHSLLLIRAHGRLREELARRFPAVAEVPLLDLFRHPTVAALAARLAPATEVGPAPRRRRTTPPAALSDGAIAVVGMAGRFPGAPDVGSFWRLLTAGDEGIRFFTDEELLAAGVESSLLADPTYVKARGALERIEWFDAGFFGMTSREAEIVDPQHRIFLECAWQTLERAGIDPGRFAGAIGVYAGVGFNTYWLHLMDHPELLEKMGSYLALLANDKDYLPTRVSYKLDLSGPSVSVQTACSTSLVATHLACRELLAGECDLALAGGVSVSVDQVAGYRYSEGGIASPDGHCRAFDARAQGTVGGSGVGIVALRRLADALADGDPIHAVIRGTAVNNDGSTKVGFTAPGVEGQAEVIRRALAVAKVDPATIGYVEAHGTGTALGDPIEVAALTQAYREQTDRRGYCALGSVKSNVGHLDAAAGVTGLIKAVLAVESAQVPASLHFQAPNPKLDLEESPFYVNAELSGWPLPGSPRRAAVSSFGIGGTNAHAIVEEAPPWEPSGPSRPWQLLVLSAKTGSALADAAGNLARFLEAAPEAPLADVAHTLQVGRAAFEHRRFVVCDGAAGASAELAVERPARTSAGRAPATPPPLAFLVPGQGAQYPGMGRELYGDPDVCSGDDPGTGGEAVFRREVDACCEILAPLLGRDLRPLLFAREGDAGAAEELRRTALAQPALFVVEVALARLWESWGVRPAALLGHSSGELAAAHLAGVLSREEALALVAARGRLMQELPPGAMLALTLSAQEVAPRLGPELALAAINGPSRVVVSGPAEAVEGLAAELAAEGVTGRLLATSHAFHSSMMEPILEPFAAEVAKVRLRPPERPWISSLTGRWITPEEATDPEYWVRQLRSPVRFAAGVESLLAELPGAVLLEVGPGGGLGSLARGVARGVARSVDAPGERAPVPVAIPSLADSRDGGTTGTRSDLAILLTALGRLWTAGVAVDWQGFAAGEHRRRVALPTYPFERRRYWLERSPAAGRRRKPSAGKRPDVAEWFYTPGWQPTPPPPETELTAVASEQGSWLLFLDRGGLGEALAARLSTAGVDVVRVRPGAGFARPEPGLYEIGPDRAEDYQILLDELRAGGGPPERIVHLWGLDPEAVPGDGPSLACASLFWLGRALARTLHVTPLTVAAVTAGAQAVEPGERPVAEKTTALGPLWVLAQENPHVGVRGIDLDPDDDPGGGPGNGAGDGSREEAAARAERLLGELLEGSEPLVAWRSGRRFRRLYQPLPLAREPRHRSPFRRRGTYLLIGGMGRIGLSLAQRLSTQAEARLVLVGRSRPEPASPAGRRLAALEAAGGELLTVTADAADAGAMEGVLRLARERFGAVDGLFYLAGGPAREAFQPLEETTPEGLERHFRSKVAGVRVLGELLDRLPAGEKPGFCLLFSSLASVLGGLGFAAYGAANLYLDAFAVARDREGSIPWVSVAWDGWLAPGEEAGGGEGPGSSVAELAMTHDEGLEALERILLTRLRGQVVVSTGDLEVRLERWLRSEPEATAAPALHARPELSTGYAEPTSETERRVAELWGELLGLSAVGVDDNFYELGGDSLLATQVISRLRRMFQVELPMSSLFETPTVAGVAAALEAGLAEEREAGRLEALLGRIEGMSSEEIAARLTARESTTKERS